MNEREKVNRKADKRSPREVTRSPPEQLAIQKSNLPEDARASCLRHGEQNCGCGFRNRMGAPNSVGWWYFSAVLWIDGIGNKKGGSGRNGEVAVSVSRAGRLVVSLVGLSAGVHNRCYHPYLRT